MAPEDFSPTHPLYCVATNEIVRAFPPLDHALAEPDGLLAAGGDLHVQTLVHAYRLGIFPWYSDGQPILWWSPAYRSVLYPNEIHISRSLKKSLRRSTLEITFDTAFRDVIAACAAPRDEHGGTWITPEMLDAYVELHQYGYAHSVETWLDGNLVGGLYGVAIGRVFFGESMFSRVSDASKFALVGLCNWLIDWEFELIDCQIHNPHLASMGAQTIPRQEFKRALDRLCKLSPHEQAWRTTLP